MGIAGSTFPLRSGDKRAHGSKIGTSIESKFSWLSVRALPSKEGTQSRSRTYIAPERGSESDWIVQFATRQGRTRTRTYLNHVLAEPLTAEVKRLDWGGPPNRAIVSSPSIQH
jgi:hypothetical protein